MVQELRTEYEALLNSSGRTRSLTPQQKRALRDQVVTAIQAQQEVEAGTRTSSGVAIPHPQTAEPVTGEHSHTGSPMLETVTVNSRGKTVVSQSHQRHTHPIEWPTGVTPDQFGFSALALIRYHTRKALH